MYLYRIILCAIISEFVDSMAMDIPNSVIGTPTIRCASQSIDVSMLLESPMVGNVYTKGFFSNPACRSKGLEQNTTVSLSIPLTEQCGLRRSRSMNPRGMVFESIVVVMFHPIFLTKADKSYHVKCIYRESDIQVQNNIDVSVLPPTELAESEEVADSQTVPICHYEVLSGGPKGPPLKFATIGEIVYHKWSCDKMKGEDYCMIVHTCVADDGQGTGQPLIDSDGCSLDEFLLPNLEFSSDLAAGQHSPVFKFADQPTIFFSCMIKLQLKEDSACLHPSDYCGSAHNRSIMTSPIPPDFPRPDPQGLNQSPPLSTPDLDFEDDSAADNMIDKRGALRRVRDAARSSIEMDVAAAPVDVVEINENDILLTEDSSSLQRKRENVVCVSRLSAALSLSLLLCVSALSLLVHYALFRRVHYTKCSKKFLPGP